jgi:hypothetical protein
MTVYLVHSLLNMQYIHLINLVLAKPSNVCLVPGAFKKFKD